MKIVETFPAPATKAGALFWLPQYVSLARSVYHTYTATGEAGQRALHITNCAARWGITRRCAEALLTSEATYEVSPEHITITRTVQEL